MSLFLLEDFVDETEELERREVILNVARDRRRLRNASNPLDLEEIRFKKVFRLTKDAFLKLLDDIDSNMPESERTYAIPKILKLACFLRFCGEGGYQTGVGNDFHLALSQSAVSDVLNEMLQLFENHVCPKWIELPRTREEEEETKSFFFGRSGIPGIIGCVDGTHIKIRSPFKREKHLYYNRKRYYSINAMVMCDHKMKIRYINARFPGACHDAHVFDMSTLKSVLEQRQRNGMSNSWILGDAGYPLRPYLITPFRNTEENSREALFNKKHSKARSIVERTIGVLKNRFRCLLGARELHYMPEKCTKIINACVALHNMCIHYCVEFPETTEDFEEMSFDDENENAEQNFGSAIRNGLMNVVT